MMSAAAVSEKSPLKIAVMTLVGISGQGTDFLPLVKQLDKLMGEKVVLDPIFLNYTKSVESGIDAFALHAMQVLHARVDLFDPRARYVLLAHSAGGAVLSRLLDLLMNGESLVLGHGPESAVLTGELDCYLTRHPLKQCEVTHHDKQFTRPAAVVAMEPSLLFFDVTERQYSEDIADAFEKGQVREFWDLQGNKEHSGGKLPGHFSTVGNWAADLASLVEAPKDAGWITDAIENKGWTWNMFRGLCAGLVHWCPESNPQAEFVAQYIKEGGSFTYVAGTETDNKFRAHMVKVVLEKEYGLKAVETSGEGGVKDLKDGQEYYFHAIPEAGHEMYADNLPVTSDLISVGLMTDLPKLFAGVEDEILHKRQ